MNEPAPDPLPLYRRTPKIDEPTLRRLYTAEHLTFQQIGDQLGISRSAVAKYAKRYHIPASEGERVRLPCSFCNAPLSVTRKRFLALKSHYCNASCYHAHRLAVSHYAGEWRQGQRKARAVTQAQPGQVVHHIDGNPHNNSPTNLQVFNTHAEHMAHHHAIRTKSIASET